MILTVETDVIDAVSASNDIAIDVLRQCAIAIDRGKHIIEIKYTDVIKLLNMTDKFSRKELAAFDKARMKYFQLAYLKSVMCVRCIISFKNKTENKDGIIYINPNENRCFEFFEETHLLVENIEDAFFYRYLSDYFQRRYKTRSCNLCSYKLMGGGNTTSKVIEYEIDLQEHFVLSIADSDKHFDGDAHLGETASKIKCCLSNNPFNCHLYYMTKVCEIENLIPFKYISDNPNYKGHILVTDQKGFNRSYFDMKDGVHYSYMFTDKGFNYWSTQLSHLADANVFAQIDTDRKSLSKEDFNVKHKGKHLFDAFGTQILTQSLERMKSDKAIVTDADLTSEQQFEWETIGNLITSWCCCYAKHSA